MPPMNVASLESLVKQLHEKGAIHKKRGFSLADTTPQLATNHLLEEVVELQGECILGGTKETIKEEAADVMAIFLHLLHVMDISLEEVLETCEQKLRDVFTFDPSEVISKNPGLTRRARE